MNAASRDDAQDRQQRGTRQLLVAKGCFFISAYVISAILARQLGASEYGIYGVVISVLLWLEMLVHAGVPGATAKLIADNRHDPHDVECSARALLLGLSVLLLGICWFLAPPVASLMRIPNGEFLFRIAIIDLPFAAFYASYDGVLYGRRSFGVIAVAQAIYAMSKLGGVVALSALGFSVERVLVVNVLATFVVCTVLTIRYRHPRFKPVLGIIGKIAAIAAPMAVYLIASQILVNLDLWSLKSLWDGDGEVVGQYVASMNLARILSVIPAAQGGVLFTSVAWAVASRDILRAQQHIHEASRFAILISIAALVILSLDGSEVLSVLFSKAYIEGHRFLPIQLAAFGLFALLDVFSHALMAAGRQYIAAAVLVTTAPLVWLSNYLLIPRFGAFGAATSLLLGMSISTIFAGAIAHRHFGTVIPAPTVIRALAAALAVALVSVTVTVRGPVIIIKLAGLSCVYLLALYVLGEITRKDFGFSTKRAAKQSTEALSGT